MTVKPEMVVYEGTMFEFFADPYLLRLKFNEQIVNMNLDESPNDLVWNQQSYLCRLKKMNYKQPFTGFDTEEDAKKMIFITIEESKQEQ